MEWNGYIIGGFCCIVVILKDNKEIFYYLEIVYFWNLKGKICYLYYLEKGVVVFLM